MRKNRPSRRSDRNTFSRIFGGRTSGVVRKAPRRRDVERLEGREMMAVVGTPTNEPYFFMQWHLDANGQLVEQPTSPTYQQSAATIDINAVKAWALGYTGAGVNVGVVDDGVDLAHEDLQAGIVLLIGQNGEVLNYVGNNNDPTAGPGDFHGTAVAGLIGARDNGIGMVGVAYGSSIVPIRLLGAGAIVDPETGEVTFDPAVFNQANANSYVQFAGIPLPGDDYFENIDQIIQVFNRSYGPSDETRVAAALSPVEREALRAAATLGRGSWLDLNGDGLYDVSEIRGLGSINVIAAGNGAGAGFVDPFNNFGVYDSSQYDGSANNRYVIAVGAVDFDGSYTNLATGARGSFAEMGTNVLVVAPSSTAAPQIGTDQNLGAGVWTTDITGDNGYNGPPIFGFEADGDYLPDAKYTSTFGGTSAAAPIVTGVIAMMLEANPKLSYRDVQQILLQSAQQVDQFDESWVVNGYQYFEDVYTIPQYNYTNFDLDPEQDGPELENVVVMDYTDDEIIRGFFLNNPDLDVFDAFASNVDVTEFLIFETPPDSPVLFWPVDFDSGSSGRPYLYSPIQGVDKGIGLTGATLDGGDIPLFGQSASNPLVNGELKFENGVGFTVSHGFGDYLEEYGYAHGLVDAELAVKLALAWEQYDLYLKPEVTITTAIDGGAPALRVQGRAVILDPGSPELEVPGGIVGQNGGAINTLWYQEWLKEFQYTTASVTVGDAEVEIGSVLTNGPWFYPDGLPPTVDSGSDRGDSRLMLRIDPQITTDFLSTEWLEFTTQIVAGDVDKLRISILSPDGTQTELNPYRHGAGDVFGGILQEPQTSQGTPLPGDELLGEDLGGYTVEGFIDGNERTLIAGIDLEDAVPAGTSWTWSTNRHWGEMFSTGAHDFDNPNSAVEGQWFIVIENWGDLPVDFGGQFEVAIHGAESTGNRIQGKLGVDDNAQGRVGQDGDELFNFNRGLTFGQMTVTSPTGGGVFNVVLDNADDSVHYSNNYYETVDKADGSVFRYAVIDQTEYEALAEVTKGLLAAPGTSRELFEALIEAEILPATFALPRISEGEAEAWYAKFGDKLGLESVVDPETGDTNGDGVVDEIDAFAWEAELAERIFNDMLAAETYKPLLGFNLDPATSLIRTTIDSAGNAFTYQNFDFNQESFASAVTVAATQYVVDYDAAGNAIGRTATGVIQYFTTGADGNYWFDVEATPQAPILGDFPTQAAYDAALALWLADYGVTFEYEISVVESGDFDRVIDRDYSAKAEAPRTEERVVNNVAGSGIDYSQPFFPTLDVELGGANVTYQTGVKSYNVQLFASPLREAGQATIIKDINFLLEVDPALTNVETSGTVFRDRNGDGIQQAGLEELIGGVTVYHDANKNGALDSGETTAVTAADGTYSFVIGGLTSSQVVTISLDASTIPAGLEPLNPLSGSKQITVSPGQPVATNFTLRRIGGEPAQVVGVVFEDIDQDGVRDAGEFGFADTLPIRVYIDLNNNLLYDLGEPSDETDGTGQYLIEADLTGTYQVRIVTPNAQITQTSPAGNAGISVTLVAGQTINQGYSFGVYDGRIFDFGDLFVDGSRNYPTLLANNGARHVVIPGVRLGMLNDVDSDGFQSAVRDSAIDGLGDDYNGVDDEDGVRLVSQTITPNGTIEFDIMAFGAGGVLNAWFDFNNDGDWNDAGEKIFNNVEDMQVLDPLNPVARRFTVQVPANVDTSATFYAARFRWGSAGLGYAGVANSGEVEDYLFAATAPIVISGNVRNDADGDGVFETGDTAVSGVRVFFDRDLDGVLDADEPRAITDASGAYRLEINSTTTLDVTLRLDLTTLPAGINPLVPIDGIFNQTLAPSAAVTSNFLIAAPQGVSGFVFSDADNDGVRDAGENGFAGIVVEVFRDADSNGTFETLVDSQTTNSLGAYTIGLPSVGQYQVRVNLAGKPFVSQSLPSANAGRTVTVANGVYTTVGDFGVFDAIPTFTLDYGDLILGGGFNYPTTLTDNGARHTIVPGTRLGTVGPDADPGSLESVNALADDNLFSPDDEDGVKMASNIAANSDVSIDVTASGTASDRLHAWIDFNNDGDWDDAGEQITPVGGLGLTSGVTTRLVINTTGIAVDGTTTNYAARFRWGQGIAGYTGLASTGEVEDYRLPRLLNSAGLLDGDYNGDGQITLADQVVWRENYGSTINFAADGNRDGVVNAADYTVWRDAYDAAQGAPAQIVAPATQPEEFAYLSPLEVAEPVTPAFVTAPELETAPALVTAPPVVTMPIVENALEVTVFDADAFAPMYFASPQVTSILDESLAVEEEEAEGGDAIDAALLQWALGSAADDVDADSEYSLAAVAEEEADEFEEAFASAFAF